MLFKCCSVSYLHCKKCNGNTFLHLHVTGCSVQHHVTSNGPKTQNAFVLPSTSTILCENYSLCSSHHSMETPAYCNCIFEKCPFYFCKILLWKCCQCQRVNWPRTLRPDQRCFWHPCSHLAEILKGNPTHWFNMGRLVCGCDTLTPPNPLPTCF